MDIATMKLLERIVSLEKRFDGLEIPEAGGQWVNWTPTLLQGVSISFSTNWCLYSRIGKVAIVNLSLSATSAGTAGQSIVIEGQPSAIQTNHSGGAIVATIGAFSFLDSGTAVYTGSVVAYSSVAWVLTSYGGGFFFGSTPAITLASGDVISMALSFSVG